MTEIWTGTGSATGGDTAPGSSRQQLMTVDFAGAWLGQQPCDSWGAHEVPMSIPMPRHRNEPRPIARLKTTPADFVAIIPIISENLRNASFFWFFCNCSDRMLFLHEKLKGAMIPSNQLLSRAKELLP